MFLYLLFLNLHHFKKTEKPWFVYVLFFLFVFLDCKLILSSLIWFTWCLVSLLASWLAVCSGRVGLQLFMFWRGDRLLRQHNKTLQLQVSSCLFLYLLSHSLVIICGKLILQWIWKMAPDVADGKCVNQLQSLSSTGKLSDRCCYTRTGGVRLSLKGLLTEHSFYRTHEHMRIFFFFLRAVYVHHDSADSVTLVPWRHAAWPPASARLPAVDLQDRRWEPRSCIPKGGRVRRLLAQNEPWI